MTVIVALIGACAIAAGLGVVIYPARPEMVAIVSGKGEALQGLAKRSCNCERRGGGKSCWDKLDKQIPDRGLVTSCDPVYTTSRWHGNEQIMTGWHYLASRGEILLCSREEAQAAEQAYFRFARTAPDGRSVQEEADRIVRGIATGVTPSLRPGAAGCMAD